MTCANVAPTFRSACADLKVSAKTEESFWVNIIGRAYPPPNRVFRWWTERMKIDPVNALVKQRVGHWGEAILHLGAAAPKAPPAPKPWPPAQCATACGSILTCRASGCRIPLNSSRPKRFGPTCFRTTTPGAETIAPCMSFAVVVGPNSVRPRPSAARPYTPAPATVSADESVSRRIRLRLFPVVAIPPSGTGYAPWLIATKPAKGRSPDPSWPVLCLTNRRAGLYAGFEISSPSDQPQGLRRGFAFMGSSTCQLSPGLNASSLL